MRGNVLALVQLLANNSADPALIQSYYDAEVIVLAQDDEWLTQATALSFNENTSVVSLPLTLINILDIFYDDQRMSEMSLRDLQNTYGPEWRNMAGKPEAYTLESQTTKTIEICPVPDATSPAIIPIHGLPLGWDYAPYNGAVIHTETRNDVPEYLEMPLALRILAREFARESDHMDLALAASAGQLAVLLLEMMK